MTTSQKKTMYQQIEQYGNNLNQIFNTSINPVKLCKTLRRLELKANHAATCLLNTNTLHLIELNRFTGYDVKQATEAEQNKFFDKIIKSVTKTLGDKAKDIIFINFDARGYSLKIKSEYIKQNNISITQDWGGYGIIAPDFTPTF